jgi:hypothetical protein
VLADTDGAAATVLERPGAEPILLAEQPQGWGADALRRTLGLPTPAPEHPVSACVEATWIAHLAALAWPAGIDRLPPLTWEQVARVHPLADPCGAVPTPQALAHSTCSLDRESSWSRLLQSVATEITGATPSPPGGRTVPLAAWFDQGSFSRWMLRQPDTDQVLLDLLDHLTDHAAEQPRRPDLAVNRTGGASRPPPGHPRRGRAAGTAVASGFVAIYPMGYVLPCDLPHLLPSHLRRLRQPRRAGARRREARRPLPVRFWSPRRAQALVRPLTPITSSGRAAPGGGPAGRPPA